MDINSIRKENLKIMIDREGGRQAFIAKTGKSGAQISQLLSNTANSRNIGNKLARELERLCGYPEGFMDERRAWYSVEKGDGGVAFKRTAMGSGVESPIQKYRARSDVDLSDIAESRDPYDDNPEAADAEDLDELISGKVEEIGVKPVRTTYRRDPRLYVFRRKLERDIQEMLSGVTKDASPFLFIPQLAVKNSEEEGFAGEVIRREENMRPFPAAAVPMHSRDSDALSFLVAEDKAMEPLINHLDTVVVGPPVPKIQAGKVYAIRIRDELKIRRVFVKPNGNLRIASENPLFPEEEVAWEDREIIQIIGEVIWRQGRI